MSVYNRSVKPLLTKFPLMTSEYESINVPGMYFAGQLGECLLVHFFLFVLVFIDTISTIVELFHA